MWSDLNQSECLQLTKFNQCQRFNISVSACSRNKNQALIALSDTDWVTDWPNYHGNQVTKRTHSTITTSDLVDSLHGKSSHEMDYHSTLQTNSGHINYDWLWITFLVVQCSDHCQSATAPGPGSDSGQALLFICQQCDPFSSNTVLSSVLQITCLFTNSRLLSFHVPSEAIHIHRSSILPYCRRTFSPSRPGLESWNIQSRT